MPAVELMTWEPETGRWLKWYKGKMYARSCRQLGTERTKEASLQAANAWWRAKELELNGTVARKEAADTYRAMAGVADSAWQSAMFVSEAQKVEQGEGPLQKLEHPFDAAYPASDTAVWKDRTRRGRKKNAPNLGHLLATWLEHQRLFVPTEISLSRFCTLRTHLNRFVSWVGPDKTAAEINELTLKGFVAELLKEIKVTKEKRTKSAAGKKKGMTATYGNAIMVSVKHWIRALYRDRSIDELPRNLDDPRLHISVPKPVIRIVERPMLKRLLAEATDKLKLYLLLMLNCGMYQADIAELALCEIDEKAGTIKRPRTKTPDGPVVTYWLWPQTLELLKRFMVRDNVTVLNFLGNPVALLNDDGGKLAQLSLTDDGRESKRDNIKSAYFRLVTKLNLDAPPLKCFRKTGASTLETHNEFKHCANYYLAHSPRGVNQTSYIIPDDVQFKAALTWLGETLLGD